MNLIEFDIFKYLGKKYWVLKRKSIQNFLNQVN